MKAKNKTIKKEKARLIAIMLLAFFVILTGLLYFVTALMKGNNSGAILGLIIAISIVAFALIAFRRGNRDLREGYPLHDERSRRVMEKATSKAFLVSLYLLLAIGFLSDDIIQFRDVSQATSAAIAGMTILFLIFWVYYNKKEL